METASDIQRKISIKYQLLSLEKAPDKRRNLQQDIAKLSLEKKLKTMQKSSEK